MFDPLWAHLNSILHLSLFPRVNVFEFDRKLGWLFCQCVFSHFIVVVKAVIIIMRIFLLYNKKWIKYDIYPK